MNDQQLLELAAKAAGIGPILCYESMRNCLRIGTRESYKIWFPLTGSDHAFGLAVKLHMTLVMLTGECEVLFDNNGRECSVVQDDGAEGELSDSELTRRAIVRAAAEIGRAMP